jgi:drug/metabolite transporter (DMT)-like permease
MSRIVEEQIGVCAYTGIVFLVSGLLSQWGISRKEQVSRDVFTHPALYGRWIFFILHEALILTAIGIVHRDNIPMVILMNYLWPTAIIICSIFVAGVEVKNWSCLSIGTLIVLLSLCIEIVGGRSSAAGLFSNATDCAAYALAAAGALSWGLYCAISRRAGDASGGGSVVPLFQLTLGLGLPLSFLPTFSAPWALTWGGAILLAVYCVAQTFVQSHVIGTKTRP